MKKNPLTITVGILLLIIFGLWLCVFQVRKSEVVLITTFGKPTKPYDQPGAYFKWPPPIQRAYTFDQRIQNFEDRFEEALTSDHYNLMSMVYVGWKIKDAEAFFPKFATGAFSESDRGSINQAESKLEGLLRNAKNSVVGKHPLSDFVSTDPGKLKFEVIEKEILADVQDQVNARNYGIVVEYLGIKRLGFPDSVTQSIFDQMSKERQVQVTTIQSQGETEAANIRIAANTRSAGLLVNAQTEATRIRGQAQAEAAKSFAVFEQNPELARFLLNLNALEQSLKDRATLIFDNHTQPYNLFQQGYSPTNTTGKK
jgi:membrane protease subunit HflC